MGECAAGIRLPKVKISDFFFFLQFYFIIQCFSFWYKHLSLTTGYLFIYCISLRVFLICFC